MNNFFKSLSDTLENEGDKITLIIQKTREELTTSTILKVNMIESSFIATGLPEELDENYLGELQKPKEKIRAFKSTADLAEAEESEEEEEEGEDNPKGKGSKKATKKAESKKVVKKSEDSPSTPSSKEDEEAKAKVKEDEESRKKLEQDNKDKFDKYMSDGKQEFDARKYEDAEISFKNALDLFPDNKQADEHFKKAKSWVDRLIESNVISPRKEAN